MLFYWFSLFFVLINNVDLINSAGMCIKSMEKYTFFNKVFLFNAAGNLHMLDGTSIHDVIGGDIFFEIVDPEELEYTYRLRPAKDFGGSFNSNKFKVQHGILVPTVPKDGCTKIRNYGDIRGNIALIERG